MYNYFFQSKQMPDGKFDRAYNQTDHARFYDELHRGGVLANKRADSFLVTAGTGEVVVSPGAALVNGYMAIETTTTHFAVSGTKKQRVMLRCDISDDVRAFSLRLDGSGTEYPAPVRAGNVYELCLANVDVNAGVPTVTDTRADYGLCGFGAAWGLPAYQPPTDVPALVWDYALFPDSQTPDQRAMVESTPDWMEQYNASRTSRFLRVYATPGTYTFTAPGTGDYIVEVVGGGGWSSPTGLTPAAGGGYAKKLLSLARGQQVAVTVGAAGSSDGIGGTSSFGAYVSATGGRWDAGGAGIGGELSISGSLGNNNLPAPGASFLCSAGAYPKGFGIGGHGANIGTGGCVIISR